MNHFKKCKVHVHGYIYLYMLNKVSVANLLKEDG